MKIIKEDGCGVDIYQARMQYKYTSLRCYIWSGYLRVKLTIYSSTYETVQWIWHVFEVTRSAIRSQVPRWKFVADLQSTPAMEGYLDFCIFNDFNWFPISSRQTVLWAVSNRTCRSLQTTTINDFSRLSRNFQQSVSQFQWTYLGGSVCKLPKRIPIKNMVYIV